MDKLLWVAAPLLLTLAALGWMAWRGRMPSRVGLNVGFSLLLLFYVLGTAALGIFWVANQQLPVFDWHYLFGHATVLLLVVHLAFNLRVVWQVLRRGAGRRRETAPAAWAAGRAPGAQGPARRQWLGLFGVGGLAAAGGLGYLLGLRHGRTELVVQASAASSDPRQHAWAVVERFHALTVHTRAGVVRRAASPQWALAPPAFKRYAHAQRLALALPGAAASLAPSTASPGPAPGLPHLAQWLWHVAGVSARQGGIAFRTSPSSGALFATELYVQVLDLPGVPAGLWHYDAEGHALERLQDPSPLLAGDSEGGPAVLGLAQVAALPEGCVAVLLASAVFARSGHKYGDRTYRYVTADLGHALENLRVAARLAGAVQAEPLLHFDDAAANRYLGLDPREEAVLAVVALRPALPQERAARQEPSAAPPDAAPWTVAPWPAAEGTPTALDLTAAVHAATSLQRLRGREGLSLPAREAPPPAPRLTPADGWLELPEPAFVEADGLRGIAARRSVRRFARTPVPAAALAALLQAMTVPAPLLSSAVRIDVLTPAAQGLPPAAWRHEAPTRTLHRRVAHDESLRARARAAALDQDVIGEAALVFVLSLDRQVLMADPLGPARGWRHGFIEAGLVGERLYLAAPVLGLGVCAVGAFYDDEASALVGVDPAREWVVHFAAVGIPA